MLIEVKSMLLNTLCYLMICYQMFLCFLMSLYIIMIMLLIISFCILMSFMSPIIIFKSFWAIPRFARPGLSAAISSLRSSISATIPIAKSKAKLHKSNKNDKMRKSIRSAMLRMALAHCRTRVRVAHTSAREAAQSDIKGAAAECNFLIIFN